MTRLVIFDLDGTLLNTLEDLANATNHALEMCGFPSRNVSEYNALVGRGIFNLFRGAVPEGKDTVETVDKMTSFFVPYYNEHKSDCTKPYDGIHTLLRDVTSDGIAVAVASNKYQEASEELVHRFFPDISFIKIYGQRTGMPIKPDPEIVNRIMAEGGIVNKEDVLYTGDSNVYMQTGLNAGVRTVGVTWGFRSRKELEAYHPWRIADSPEELKRFILE